MQDSLLFITWNVSPKIAEFQIFGSDVVLGWYGLLFACSFFLGQRLLTYIFKKEGKPVSDVDQILIYVVIATVIGARVGHYLFYEWELLIHSPMDWLVSMVTPPFSGLASHGATIAIPIGVYLYSRTKADQHFLWVLDRVVITISMAGLIRIGNLMNSEIYGSPTSLPWGFLFVRETDPAFLPLVPRHPTQLYEAFFCVFLLIFSFWLWSKKRNSLPEGFLSGIYIILLFTFRFFIEFLKNNQSDFEYGLPLNMGQLLSIPSIFLGVAILFYAKKKQSTSLETTATV